MKSLALLAALAATCLCVGPAAAARPAPSPAPLVQPTQLPVPADVVAAHPDGHAVTLRVEAVPLSPGVAPDAAERVTCWRATFVQDNSGVWGTEQEYVIPVWCGNGSALRSVNTSFHGQICSVFVSCLGESGFQTWYGCPNGCDSLGQQITGRFKVHAIFDFNVENTLIFQLYGNGQSWSYGYHN